MTQLLQKLQAMQVRNDITKLDMVNAIEDAIRTSGYEMVDQDVDKPWGAYFRMNSTQAEEFVVEFFSGLDVNEAKLGVPDAELSPKILLVQAGERLSWQYHHRRAERWRFITPGSYYRNTTDDQLEPHLAMKDDVVQFLALERHRLVGHDTDWTIVAEIWQHTQPSSPSNEADIVRLADDYNR